MSKIKLRRVKDGIRKSDLIIILGVLVYSYLCYEFFSHTMDDSYITFRYAKNFVEVGEPLWNVGGSPVEGYTSTLWLLLSTIPYLLEVNVVLSLKLLGFVSGVLTILGLYVYSVKSGSGRVVGLIITSVLFLSSEFAVISIQGMETTTTIFITLIACILSVRIIEGHRDLSTYSIYSITIFLAMISRPDLVTFSVVLTITLAMYVYYEDYNVSFILINGLISGLLGVVYMVSRYLYFGHLTPNSFAVKSASSSLLSVEYLADFVLTTIRPLTFLTLLILTIIFVSRSQNDSGYTSYKNYFLIPSILVYFGTWLFITPTQGYFSRLVFPMYPMIAIQIIILLKDMSLTDEIAQFIDQIDYNAKNVIYIIVIISCLSLCFSWYISLPSDSYKYNDVGITDPIKILEGQPVTTYEYAKVKTSVKNQHDRVQIGKELSQFNDLGYSIYTTESGAVPYYSEWKAIDNLGLNNESIARDKVERTQIIKEANPEIVMLLSEKSKIQIDRIGSIDTEFLSNNGYKTVTHTDRSDLEEFDELPPERREYDVHYIFINEDTEQLEEITCELRTIEDIRYYDDSEITSDIPESVNVECDKN